MATFGNQNYTGFQAVNIRGSVALRLCGNDPYNGTLWISPASLEANRAWSFPDKSGGFGVTGTFLVSMPAITSWSETAVTISGIRREDALLVQIQDMMGTVTTGRTYPIIAGARPENGYVYLTFYNPTGTATIAYAFTCAYTAFR